MTCRSGHVADQRGAEPCSPSIPDPSYLAHKRPRTLLAGGSETLTLRRGADVPIQGQERNRRRTTRIPPVGGRAGKGVVVTGGARPEVLIVDDDARVRRALRCMLDDYGMAVVGEAADGRAGVELAWRLAPDVVVMDLHMPVLGGIEATRQLSSTLPRTRVVVCTASDEPAARERAMRAGAVASVVKGEHPSTLIAAIKSASARARR
jgi:CheY-like chemotaxis protein